MVTGFESMSDFEAASIINRAFPKHPLFCKTDMELSIVDIMDALYIAKKRCLSFKLRDCINWSRGIIYKK